MKKPRHNWNEVDWTQHDSALAKTLGCPVATVWRARERLGKDKLPRAKGGGRPRKHVYSEQEIADAIKLRDNLFADRVGPNEVEQSYREVQAVLGEKWATFKLPRAKGGGRPRKDIVRQVIDAMKQSKHCNPPLSERRGRPRKLLPEKDSFGATLSEAQRREGIPFPDKPATDIANYQGEYVWSVPPVPAIVDPIREKASEPTAADVSSYFEYLSTTDDVRKKAGELPAEGRKPPLIQLISDYAASKQAEPELGFSLRNGAELSNELIRQIGRWNALKESKGITNAQLLADCMDSLNASNKPTSYSKACQTMHAILDAHESADTTKTQLIQELRSEIP